jgi:hypothetical protein
VTGTALVDDQAQIAIENFTAGSAGFALQLGGKFDARAFVMDLNFALKTSDAKLYAALLPVGMTLGPLAMTGTISGTPELPIIDAKIQANDVALRGYRMARLDAQIKTAPDDKKGLTLSLDGQASGLAADDAAVTAALGEHAHVTAQGTFTAQRQIALDSYSLDGPAAQLRFDGHADAQTVSGKLQVARLDLGVAAPLAGQRLGGQLAMNADIDSAADFSSFAIALDGHLDNFSSATPALDGLLVPSLKLAGTLKRDANGAIVASNMTASSAMLQATLDGRLDQAVANLKAHAVLADARMPLAVASKSLRCTLLSVSNLKVAWSWPPSAVRVCGARSSRLPAFSAMSPAIRPSGAWLSVPLALTEPTDKVSSSSLREPSAAVVSLAWPVAGLPPILPSSAMSPAAWPVMSLLLSVKVSPSMSRPIALPCGIDSVA